MVNLKQLKSIPFSTVWSKSFILFLSPFIALESDRMNVVKYMYLYMNADF